MSARVPFLLAVLALGAPVRATPFEEGMRLMTVRRYPEAVAQLELAARTDPGSPEVLLNLGWAYWHDRRVDDAWRVGTTLTRLDPENRVFMTFLANMHIERKNYAAAQDSARQALKLAPNDHDASLVLARALFLSGRQKEGLETLEGVLARAPGDVAAKFRRAVFYSEMGRKRDALAELDALLAGDRDNADYRRTRARILSDLGRRDEAVGEWRDLTRRGLDAQALMNLGWAHWHDKDYAAAWEIATVLVKLDDSNPAFLRFASNLEIERGNFAEALRLAQKASALAPKDREASLLLSKALFRAQRVRDALAVLQALVRRLPDDLLVRQRWAELLAWTGRYEESLPLFERLIASDPDNDAYRLGRAAASYELGRHDAAVADWTALVTRPYPQPDAMRQLRDDAFDRRDWSAAAGWQERLVSASPSDPAGWEKLAKIRAEAGELDEALRAVEGAISADPVSLNAHYIKGEILVQRREWAAAAAAYELILRRNPGSVRALEGLAFAKEGAEDYPGAFRSLKRIDELTRPEVSPYLRLHEARLHAEAGRPGAALALLRTFAADPRVRIPVLLYHGISKHDRGDSIPQQAFRLQMRALLAEGYQMMTVSQLDRALRSLEPLPEKPILITFDDGRTDSFENVDPVLEELGIKATMFVHTSRLRKPHFHAAPADIAKWRGTGRWEIQAHGFQAHDPLPLDGSGRTGHFLPNRMWLAGLGRLENLAEYRARVEGDYRMGKQGVEAMIPGAEVIAFAYPYGDYGQTDDSNTPESASVNQELVRKTYRLAFVQEQHGLNTLSSNPSDLRRFAVPRYMSADQLTAHLTLSDPRVQAELLEAQLWIRADQPARALAAYARLRERGVDGPRIWADEGVAFQRGGDLARAMSLYAKASEAVVEDDERGELPRKLLSHSERAAAPTVAADVLTFSDSDTNSIRKATLRGGALLGPARLEAWAGGAEYSDRRDPAREFPVIHGREAGARLLLPVGARTWFDASYARRYFSGGVDWSAHEYALSASRQVLAPLRLTVRTAGGIVETATAIRGGRLSRSYGGGATWDPALQWRLGADYDESRFNDGNRGNALRLRATRRLPYGFSAGVAYLRADSRTARPEYYTPLRLSQYTGALSVNRLFGDASPGTGLVPFEALLRYEGGYGREPRGSRVVHSTQAVLTFRPLDRLSLTLDGRYSQSPSYISRRLQGVVAVGF